MSWKVSRQISNLAIARSFGHCKIRGRLSCAFLTPSFSNMPRGSRVSSTKLLMGYPVSSPWLIDWFIVPSVSTIIYLLHTIAMNPLASSRKHRVSIKQGDDMLVRCNLRKSLFERWACCPMIYFKVVNNVAFFLPNFRICFIWCIFENKHSRVDYGTCYRSEWQFSIVLTILTPPGKGCASLAKLTCPLSSQHLCTIFILTS